MTTFRFEDKYGELVSTALEELRSSTNITQMTPGGKARALIEIIMRETAGAYTFFSTELLQTFIKYAEGRNLDLLGEMMGLPRTPATRNVVSTSNAIQKFYVRNGTFGDINNGSSIVIPAGVIVRTRTLTEGEKPIQYILTDSCTCSAAESVAYADIRAFELGTASNVGAGRLTVHDFEQYADYLNESLKTINIEGIAYGQDIETDTNYRYRLSQQTVASEAANATSIRMAALSVPGVANVLLDEYSRGIGSGTVYIKATTPTVSEALVAAVNDELNIAKAFGNFVEARAPALVGIEMVVTLHLYKPVTETEQSALIDRVRSRLYQYINSLDINDSLEVDSIINQILRTDENIKRCGSTTRPIDQLYIWKYSASEDARIRQQAIDGYVAKNFERIVVEFSEMPDDGDPITIRIATS